MDIFEYVLKDSSLLAEETMLIDGTSVNCRATELLGMKSHVPQQKEDWLHLSKRRPVIVWSRPKYF